MADDVLTYEQINWGWLNDYAGSKFAPITFLDNLLTKDGTSFESDYNTLKDGLKEGDFIVKSAQSLSIVDAQGSSELYTTPNNKPVYFKDGIPVPADVLDVDINGNVTGNVIGNVTGDVIGNVTGNVIGNITGDVKGDVTGNVTGDINFKNKISISFTGDATGSLELTGSNSKPQVQLTLAAPSNESSGTYGPSNTTAATLAHSDTFQVPRLTVDSKGRISSAGTKTYTLPEGSKVSITKATDTTKRYILTNSTTGAESTDNKLMYYDSIYVDYNGSGVANAVLMGAAWNDYAEYRNQIETIEPGYCVASTNQGKVYKTNEKFQACDGIVSDTYGFTIGKTDECQTPLAVSGRVLAYFHGNREEYNSGDTVCAGPEGKIMKMTREEIREYPDRIVGIVSEIPEYEEWNGKKVNNRIWIKVR